MFQKVDVTTNLIQGGFIVVGIDSSAQVSEMKNQGVLGCTCYITCYLPCSKLEVHFSTFALLFLRPSEHITSTRLDHLHANSCLDSLAGHNPKSFTEISLRALLPDS